MSFKFLTVKNGELVYDRPRVPTKPIVYKTVCRKSFMVLGVELSVYDRCLSCHIMFQIKHHPAKLNKFQVSCPDCGKIMEYLPTLGILVDAPKI